jgi:serine/threonine-protein kinase
MIGKTLNHYEITGQLGKGGMGEVYKAKDGKLGREVAIKVLPEEFARDTDRVARFQREAKLLASLNHPNIAAIHGLEESGGTHFLVLELVDGSTLADRMKAGRIPAEECLKIARQIAEALEAAHDKGVIHRDLKPANIKITSDGKVKVLDFGLAKAFAGDQDGAILSNSPTLSVAATQQGVILGTAAYMSPEQAKGKTVDKRADIWAFGCVLFEMLTGQAAFQGEDVSEVLASVIKGDANLNLLPADVHPKVREIVFRCLQKDLKKRIRDIADVQFELEQAEMPPAVAESVGAEEPQSRRPQSLAWIAAAMALAAIIAGAAVWFLKPVRPPEPGHVIRLVHDLPENQQFWQLNERNIAVSPDGTQIVYAANTGLYLRSVDKWDANLIAGTEGNPEKPFFSPDGKWVGYWSASENRLIKIETGGGAPLTLTDEASTGSYSWSADGTIVYGTSGSIMRISENGGTPEPVFVKQGQYMIHPQILPDGESVLYSDIAGQPYKIMLYSPQSGEDRELFPGHAARYLPTGHIVYELEKDLLAVPFDLESLEVSGGSVPLVEGVLRRGGAPQYEISDAGTLVYLREMDPNMLASRSLLWVDRKGTEEPLYDSPDLFWHPRLSPDGTQVALCSQQGEGASDTRIWNLARRTLTRLTFDPAADEFPLWTPDGTRIIFYSGREGNTRLYLRSADGTGSAEPIGSTGTGWIYPGSWSADGKTLLVQENNTGNFRICALSMEKDGELKPLLEGDAMFVQPKISPDGRWLAYTSNESGGNEIYVRPYPEVDGGRWQVSNNGGDSPLWSPDGRELFYRNGDAAMAVAVKSDPAFDIENPTVLFQGMYYSADFIPGTTELSPWDISPDGKRFLMMKNAGVGESTGGGPRRINIILNWFEELKQRVPFNKQ